MNKHAVGYIRVSTQEQATEGISLDAQDARLKAHCFANDYTLVNVYTDAGLSGATMKRREGLHAALKAATRGRVFICYSLSRVSRSVQDLIMIAEQLQKQGADLVSLTEEIDTTTAAGKVVFHVFAAFAQFERDIISERTKTALEHKRSVGEVYGPVPFGFHAIEGRLITAPDETRVVGDLLRLRATGASLRACADHLNRAGIPPKQGGKKWHASTIRAVLKRQDAPVVAAAGV